MQSIAFRLLTPSFLYFLATIYCPSLEKDHVPHQMRSELPLAFSSHLHLRVTYITQDTSEELWALARTTA